jgi:hypothetical protein
LWTSATSGLPYTGSPYTLEGWLYASTYDGGDHQVLAYGPSSGGNYIGITYSASNVLYLGDPGVIGTSDPAPSGSLNYWYGGALSNVAIYNYALSAAQVSAHYAAQSAPAAPTRTPRRQVYVVL